MATSWSFVGRRDRMRRPGAEAISALLSGYSIEVMPRTAARIEDFRAILPPDTRVYIAHLEGTPIEDMVATARRLRDEGFPVMPHVPARLIPDRSTLDAWLSRYAGEAGVRQALVLAGGAARPAGSFENSMQLLETGLFDRNGFTRLHVAGHPEGNRDIDRDGAERLVTEALRWKSDFAARTDAAMALVTQFAFDAAPVTAWIERIRGHGINLPVHVGIAGPARLQTLVKFAAACGIGPSFDVLRKRAKDVRNLVRPFEPTAVLSDLAMHRALNSGCSAAQMHFFPLGGILACAEWANARMGSSVTAVSDRIGGPAARS